jgi:hypothetical protein
MAASEELVRFMPPCQSTAKERDPHHPLHFLRAWRKLEAVPNKGQYAAWVGFETACTLALVGGFVYIMFSH